MLTPETILQKIARKLDEAVKLCKNILEKFSKPADRSVEVIADSIPIRDNAITKRIIHAKPTITLEKYVSHRYNTLSDPRTYIALPRVNIPLPRVPVSTQHVTDIQKYEYVAMNTMESSNTP